MSCAAPGCPKPPARGLLCGWHRDVLARTLTQLRADLDGGHEPSLNGWRTGSVSGGPLASERDPVNLRAIDAQRGAPHVLRGWAVWLAPRRDPSHRPGIVEADRALLVRHFDWLCGQPEVTELWCQIRALWASLRGHLPVRRCTCGGPVWSDRGGGWCSWCATAWTGRQLLELPRATEAA